MSALVLIFGLCILHDIEHNSIISYNLNISLIVVYVLVVYAYLHDCVGKADRISVVFCLYLSNDDDDVVVNVNYCY